MSNEAKWQGFYRLIAGALLLFQAWLVIDLIPRWSVTHNEACHIPAGLACWYTGSYELYRVNPPLPRMVSTVALLNQPIISLDALTRIQDQPAARQEFEIGTFFSNTNSLYYEQLVSRVRLAGAVWVTLGGFIIWRWAGSLYGPQGGLLALAMWTLEPTVTAHSALVTADIPATVAGLVASFSFFHLIRSGSWFHAYLSGVLLGTALLCKLTLILLGPAWVVAWLCARRNEQNAIHEMPVRQRWQRILCISLLAWLTLNAGYSFSGTGTPLKEIVFVSQKFKERIAPVKDTWVGNLPCPVPTAYIRGIDTQQKDFEGGMNCYLRGEWRDHGWWYYYLYAFAIKTPLGHLALFGLALTVCVYFRQPITPLMWIIPVVIVCVASAKTGYTNHLRYILPAYPFVLISCGVLVSPQIVGYRRLRGALVAVCLVWSSLSVWTTYPYLLGYFNATVGGPQQGWRYLADSNVDWGQDWCFLRQWIDDHPEAKPFYVALTSNRDLGLYIPQRYMRPDPDMTGFAAVDVTLLTTEYEWLLDCPVVSRIGTSIFIFEVRS